VPSVVTVSFLLFLRFRAREVELHKKDEMLPTLAVSPIAPAFGVWRL